ncbi:MAG TPA: zinc-dependent alcohol dehydrogenase family protein [Polyangiales bacterium]|jgi:propanol-preferring alcohol dehydrogenase|nr:zinc-dependent alcohol dehydrogenase family protein [Polyangiales bacterium]
MFAMVLKAPGSALEACKLPDPLPGPDQLLLQVTACGICRTDLHVLDGELKDPALPLVLGHQIVGRIIGKGSEVEGFEIGARVGVPWLGWACGTCNYCVQGRENLCAAARLTGYQLQGGYAELAVANAAYCLPLPAAYPDEQAAPLLCAGLIGYRALAMTVDAKRLGLYGIGSSAHIIAQVAIKQGRSVYAFTRPGDLASQSFARSLGAVWAGGSDERPDVELDAAILFAPVGGLVPAALRALARGGRVVCAGIHMSDIPSFPYELLWGERSIASVANLTRRDGQEFMQIAATFPLHTTVTTFPLREANTALAALRRGQFQGSGVLVAGSNGTPGV